MSGFQSVNLNGNIDIKILNAENISSLCTMGEAIDLMEKAFTSINRNQCHVPLRSVVASQDQSINIFFKPAFDKNLSKFSVKLLTQNESNRELGIPTINGIVLLLDNISGEIVSLMDGNSITSLRTGAVAGLASKYLARDDSRKLAIFGCGAQGKTQMEAILQVRNIEEVYLFDKDPSAIEAFLNEIQYPGKIRFETSNDIDVLKDVDIISTATGANIPLFKLEHLKPGVHINAIGAYKPDMQEISPETIEAAALFVDQREACLKEPGDILIPLRSGLIKKTHIKADLGELACGKHPGRNSHDELTVFKSVGLAIQDLYVADRIYSKAVNAS